MEQARDHEAHDTKEEQICRSDYYCSGQITQAEDHPGKIRASKLVTFNFMRKFSNDAPRTSPLSIYCAEWQAVE
jgi:hypothetical protein